MDANQALAQFIRGIPLFSYVEPPEMADILRLMRPVELAAGEVLFREGDAGKAMWVLGTGVEVSLSTTPQQAKRPVAVAYARAGETVGEMALVDDGGRSATAVVVQGGHAHLIDAIEFQTLRSQFNSAAFKVLRRICRDLCARLRATNDRIVPAGKGGVRTPPVEGGRRPTQDELDAYEPFRGLPATVKLALSQKLELLDLEGVTPLFAEGEPPDGAWFLVTGEVSVGRNGKTLANLAPGTMFGIVSCIDDGLRSAACVTTGPARLMRLKDAEFDALFAAGNRFAFQLVDLVARQLVSHLRSANRMLPVPGGPAARPQTTHGPAVALQAPSGSRDEELIIPLELELDISEDESPGAPG